MIDPATIARFIARGCEIAVDRVTCEAHADTKPRLLVVNLDTAGQPDLWEVLDVAKAANEAAAKWLDDTWEIEIREAA